MNRRKEIENLIKNDPKLATNLLLSWETELSKVMPEDFKDWWENSKLEWPIVARLVIENLKKRENIAWEILNNKN